MYSREWYKRRKESGLCPCCGKTLDREGHYCTKCLEKVRKYKQENVDFYRKNHLCTECGKVKVPKTQRICPECLAKRDKYRKPLDEKGKARIRKYNHEQYDARSENGICTRCGKRKAAVGKKKCEICLAKNAEQHRLSRKPQKVGVKEYRITNHLCLWCGKPSQKGKKLCEEHQAQAVMNGKKSAQVSYWRLDNRLIRGNENE